MFLPNTFDIEMILVGLLAYSVRQLADELWCLPTPGTRDSGNGNTKVIKELTDAGTAPVSHRIPCYGNYLKK